MCLTILILWLTPDAQARVCPPVFGPPTAIVRATGLGRPPACMRGAQSRLMARRAAEVDAVRKLSLELGYRPRAIVSDFRYVSTIRRNDGYFEVTVEKTIPSTLSAALPARPFGP